MSLPLHHAVKAAPKPPPLSKGVSFGTAGLGGIIGWIGVHPANTLAVRMSLATMSGQQAGSFPVFATKIVRNEGVMTLYKGLGAGITRQIFYATSRYGLFEVFRDWMAQYRETDLASRLVVGVASGGAAALISCPAEVSLVRMSNDTALPVAERRNYRNVADCAVRMAREEGIGSYWRGSMPFVNRAMMVGAFQVGFFDQFKSVYKSLGVREGFYNTFCAAMTAGLIYSIATNPLETAKNRMAAQKPLKDGTLKYATTVKTITTVAGEEGVMMLWKGFMPYYLRCGGHTVGMFVAIEQLRSWYRTYQP